MADGDERVVKGGQELTARAWALIDDVAEELGLELQVVQGGFKAGSGARASGSTHDVGDVFDDSGHAKRRLALRIFKRSSEEPAPQEVLLPDVVRAKLDKLLAGRKRAGEALAATTPVFASRLGRRLSARQLRHAFGVWQKRAGFERHFNFHALRHTACTNLYRGSRDLRLTQRFARHKSVLTTSIYTHPSDEELLRSVQGLIC